MSPPAGTPADPARTPATPAGATAPSLRAPAAAGPDLPPGARAAAILPVRFASTRLPGKPLLAETGMPLIRHVWEQVRRARRLDPVIVATD
ncbi:MAG TPA: hypothetical protein VK824_11705, partial [Planctomycetota bacterium]|nr:hypothetical protein [Planctomycetota bacterium]